MKNPENSDFLVLNRMIYRIYTTEDEKTMRIDLLEQMKMLVDFDAADFYLAGEGKEVLKDPALYNCEGTASEFVDMAPFKKLMEGGKSLVIRETDLVAEEKRQESLYYKKVYRPGNWNYSLLMVLASEKQFLGIMTLYRSIGKDNFDYDDIFLLDMLKDHLSYRLYRDRQLRLYEPHKYTIVEATREFGLTGREEMVLQCIMEGKDKEEICEELSISINTFKKHSLNIYRKLQVNNRVQLFKKVLERE